MRSEKMHLWHRFLAQQGYRPQLSRRHAVATAHTVGICGPELALEFLVEDKTKTRRLLQRFTIKASADDSSTGGFQISMGSSRPMVDHPNGRLSIVQVIDLPLFLSERFDI